MSKPDPFGTREYLGVFWYKRALVFNDHWIVSKNKEELMHINIYEENLCEVTPIEVKTKQKNGVTYIGLTVHLEGKHNQITIWSTSKERLVNMFNGLGIMLAAGVRSGQLETYGVQTPVISLTHH